MEMDARDFKRFDEPAALDSHSAGQLDLGKVKIEVPAILAAASTGQGSAYIDLSSSDEEEERPPAAAAPQARPNPASRLPGGSSPRREPPERAPNLQEYQGQPSGHFLAQLAAGGGTGHSRVAVSSEASRSEKRRRLESSPHASCAPAQVKQEYQEAGQGSAQRAAVGEVAGSRDASGQQSAQLNGEAGWLVGAAKGSLHVAASEGSRLGRELAAGPGEYEAGAGQPQGGHTAPFPPVKPEPGEGLPSHLFQSPPRTTFPQALPPIPPPSSTVRGTFNSPGLGHQAAALPAADVHRSGAPEAAAVSVALQGSAQSPLPRSVSANGAASPSAGPSAPERPPASSSRLQPLSEAASRRQFWHAGDYEIGKRPPSRQQGGMDHVRVHPKFLHSNATSHKWALGALAELLDNAMDEVGHGASFCKVDMVPNPVDGQPMLLVEDDGGGMNPDRLRACMSLGYSEKSKKANTIGQYGNGFKTSTMRLGADVIVFTRSPTGNESWPTQSIGLLSFTFLRDTGHEDIVVPMIDYSWTWGGTVSKLYRSTEEVWESNLATITQWSPFRSEEELLQQFASMGEHGTKVLVYNMWLADDGNLELDFETDRQDIQVRGARDERHLRLAESGKYPNSLHFLTYRHSLRSYASILYLRRPSQFRIFLRGKEVEPHSIGDDLMHKEEVVYRPKGEDTTGMMASVTIGFVKDAKEHIDVQGFCVYHKNRLIKPFWRIWNAAGSQGRGVLGVLEANFVEPAHDKQGFEKTEVLRRLEERLLKAQKTYWKEKAFLVGYTGGGILVPPGWSQPRPAGPSAAAASSDAPAAAQNQKATLVGYVPWAAKRALASPAAPGPSSQPAATASPVQPARASAGTGHGAAASPLRESLAMPETEDVKPGAAAWGESPAPYRPTRPRRGLDDPTYRPPGGAARVSAAAPERPASSQEDLEEGEVPNGGALPWAIPVPSEAAYGEERLSQSQSQSLVVSGLQQLVDAEWLNRLLEENRDLRARCEELESGVSEIGKAEERRVAMEDQVRQLSAEREQEEHERRLLQEQHQFTERRLREQLKATILRAQAAEEKLRQLS